VIEQERTGLFVKNTLTVWPTGKPEDSRRVERRSLTRLTGRWWLVRELRQAADRRAP
jgi:hypothetical protein